MVSGVINVSISLKVLSSNNFVISISLPGNWTTIYILCLSSPLAYLLPSIKSFGVFGWYIPVLVWVLSMPLFGGITLYCSFILLFKEIFWDCEVIVLIFPSFIVKPVGFKDEGLTWGTWGIILFSIEFTPEFWNVFGVWRFSDGDTNWALKFGSMFVTSTGWGMISWGGKPGPVKFTGPPALSFSELQLPMINLIYLINN